MALLRQMLIRHGRLVRRASSLIPDVPWTMNVPPNGRMRLRLRLNKGLWLHNPMTTERYQLGVIKSLIRPGDTVYDVGANIGYVLRFMVGTCQAGKAFAFEPVPFNRELLMQNIRLGRIEDRVTVLPVAVGDTDGEIEFKLDTYTGATGSIGKVHSEGVSWEERWGTTFGKIRVPVVKLDTLLEKGEITPPRLIKVDIEGAEEFFVAGARGLLEKHRPRLVMELHTLEQARRTMQLLDDLGYYLFAHEDVLENPSYRRYTREQVDAATSREQLPFHLYASPELAELDRTIPPFEG